jgi:DNA-directed RNA polymerase subunit RPC12/RpoP
MKCSKCNKEFFTPPAQSRVDGSNICSLCGSKEAIEAAVQVGAMPRYGADEIIKELERLEAE